MLIRVITEGHQFYRSVEGHALAWGQTVESFDGKDMQVPCVTLETIDGILVIPFKSHLRYSRIEKITKKEQ